MMKHSKAKIFLAEERGLCETKHFKSARTLNEASYQNIHKRPFNDIYLVNDEVLDAGHSVSLQVKEASYIMLLPVTGAIAYKDSLGHENFVAAGQVQLLHVHEGVTLVISNPFSHYPVNFLQVRMKASAVPAPAVAVCCTYNVNEQPNKLVGLMPDPVGTRGWPFILSVGKFDGRGETVYAAHQDGAILFVFVLEGAFEVEGRLLHARDGLAVWDTNEIDMEALSNDAILLLIESNNSSSYNAGSM